MQLPEINFSEIELKEIGLWPLALRIPVIVAAGLLTLGAMYFFFLGDLIDEVAIQHKLEDDKRAEFKTKFNLAANLDAYRKQMVDIEASYKQVSRELPSSSQVPQLIDAISQEAQSNGLIAQSLKPGDEKSLSGFYKQLAINMVLSGTYNGIGTFVSELAKIPRIVTLHDFNLKRIENKAAKANIKNTSNTANMMNAGNGQPPISSAGPSAPTPPPPSNQLLFTVEARTYWLSSEPEPVKAKPGAKAPGPAGPGKPAGKTTEPATGNIKGPGVPFKPGTKLPPMPGESG